MKEMLLQVSAQVMNKGVYTSLTMTHCIGYSSIVHAIPVIYFSLTTSHTLEKCMSRKEKRVNVSLKYTTRSSCSYKMLKKYTDDAVIVCDNFFEAFKIKVYRRNNISNFKKRTLKVNRRR